MNQINKQRRRKYAITICTEIECQESCTNEDKKMCIKDNMLPSDNEFGKKKLKSQIPRENVHVTKVRNKVNYFSFNRKLCDDLFFILY